MDLMDYKSAQCKCASCYKTRTGFQISTEPETATLGENTSIFSILPLTYDDKNGAKVCFS